jgi:hypothetical protein
VADQKPRAHQGTRSLRRALIAVSAQSSLRESQACLGKRRGVMPALLEAAMLELRRSADVHDKQIIKERIGSRLGASRRRLAAT